MYKLIFLDADDTLFDYEKAEKYSLTGVLSHFNCKLDFERVKKRYKVINSNLWYELEKGLVSKEELRYKRFELLFEEFNLDYNPHEASEVYVRYLSESSFLIDDAFELCKYLSKKYKLVIITNGIKEVQISRINKSLIKDYISELIISDDIGIAKPNEKIFEHALKLSGEYLKSEILMIGDSLSSDIKGARNFGIDACWYNIHGIENTTDLTPKYEIVALDELYEIL